jgi:hypothetical protein
MPLMPPPTTRIVWLVAIEAVTSSSRKNGLVQARF